MRKILFRGRDHAGKWHKGSLVVISVEKPRQKDIAPYEVYYIKEQGLEGDEHAVDPNTIGKDGARKPHRLYQRGERFAQLIILPIPAVEFIEVGERNDATDRGANGYGSSGK